MQSDQELLRAYALTQSESAFAELVERHTGWIFAAARRRLEDDHLADDATQAVFIVLANKSQQLLESDPSSIAAWLFHVMHLTCGRMKRTRSRQERLESAATAFQQSAARELPESELRRLMEDAIAQLPPLERDAVVRRFYQGASYADIGAALDLTAEAARKRIIRALADVRDCMLLDGIDIIPDTLLAADQPLLSNHAKIVKSIKNEQRMNSIARGAIVMMDQAQAMDFTTWSVEFFVKDVEGNLDFFEKLGFRRHFLDTPDAMGRLPRASLRGGKTARIWLRRASEAEGTRPTPGGMTLFLLIEGGPEALTAHRNAIAAQSVKVSAFFDDISFQNFTVTTPDGYAIGFYCLRH